jgi:hypothetical protein
LKKINFNGFLESFENELKMKNRTS